MLPATDLSFRERGPGWLSATGKVFNMKGCGSASCNEDKRSATHYLFLEKTLLWRRAHNKAINGRPTTRGYSFVFAGVSLYFDPRSRRWAGYGRPLYRRFQLAS